MNNRLSALKHRNYALLWVGSVVSNIGSWMQMVAQGWYVYNLTGSAIDLGMVGVARSVPMLLLPLVAGVYIDRMPRMLLLKVTQCANFVVSFVLATLVVLNLAPLPVMVLFALLSGCLNALDAPTRQALVPDLVPREDLPKAIALNSVAWQGSGLFGPSLAGLCVALFGIGGAFYANSLSFWAVVAALFLMHNVPERHLQERGAPKGMLDDLREGLNYVRQTPVVLTLVLLASVTAVFGRSYQQLLPVFAKDVLDTDPAGLGFLMAAPGAGTLIAAVALSAVGLAGRGWVLFVSMFLFSGSLLAFSFSRSLPVSMLLLVFTGMATLAYGTTQATIVQLRVPGRLRGRLSSIMTMVMQGMPPIGALLIGTLGTAIGAPASEALAALVVAAGAFAAWRVVPQLLREDGAMPEAPGERAGHRYGPPAREAQPADR